MLNKMHAKKSLGQNWLKSEAAARTLVRAASLSTSDTVLEIGPGQGFLTEFLLETGARVIAVEKDDRAIPFLQNKFSDKVMAGKLKLLHGDILETEIDLPEKYKLVANIPYYITGILLRKFLSAINQPSLMVLMLQDEVAKRIVARDGRESVLSIAVKAYGEPEYTKKVPAKYFSPAPRVDSAILLIKNISRANFKNKNISEQKFFEIVKDGFSSKRKMLRNNLTDIAPEKFKRCKIVETSRAENLSLNNWLCLAEK